MEISIPKTTSLISSTGIVESVPAFDNTEHRTYFIDEELRSDIGIYERTAADFLPDTYILANEQTYTLDQVLWKDNQLKFVSEVAGSDVLLQPEEYGTVTANLGFDTWTTRYSILGNLNTSTNTWSAITNGVTHSLWEYNGFWRYEISKQVLDLYWSSEYYNRTTVPSYFCEWGVRLDGNGWLKIRWNTVTVYDEIHAEPVQSSTSVTANDGNRYSVEYYKGIDGGAKLYGVAKELTRYLTFKTEIGVTVLDSVLDSTLETKAYCHNTSNCLNEWFPKTIIRRNGVLYFRTNTDDARETKVVNDVGYTSLDRLDQVPWGWTYSRPTDTYAPLDGKQYTYVEAPYEIVYNVEAGEAFDTVAINGLIADTVTIQFTPTDGSEAIPLITFTPKNNRDLESRLSAAKTTLIAYAPRDVVGTVTITATSTGNVRIGGISLGLSANAGFTNLTFTNRFKDYSPYEKDIYGNVLYIPGVKTNMYIGTVDIWLKDYDMINRLMASIGGETVILNGSSNKDNSGSDNVNFFASTMVVGRIRNFVLKTKLDNEELGQMATYSFEIEEDV